MPRWFVVKSQKDLWVNTHITVGTSYAMATGPLFMDGVI